MYIKIKNILKAHLPPMFYERLRWLWSWLCKVAFRLVNIVLRRFRVRNDKIVFDNYICRGFGCNPKYVAQKLIERGLAGKFDLVWILAPEDMAHSEVPSCLRIVRYNSLASFWEYATAKLWVSNYHKRAFVRYGLSKRKEQFYIQMWHGSLGIKKIENDVPTLRGLKGWLPTLMRSSEMVDYWISNSDYETNVYKSAFGCVKDERILLYGHPRNDIFFDPAAMRRAYEKVVGRYGLQGKRLLLYVPTFRERSNRFGEFEHHVSDSGIELDALLPCIQQRFGGEWALLVRQHPSALERLSANISITGVVDVTSYADIQELLAAADCLLTDYSSCVFDFMLTRRPAFLFVPDIQEYNTERGFYYPIETTPFPLARSNEELLDDVSSFDAEAYRSKVDAFLQSKGCMEDGHASERVADLIERLMRENTA